MTIPCTVCPHESPDVIEAWRHRQEHPWLPPAPIIQKGMLVSVVISDRVFTDYVTHVDFDSRTGNETVMMGEDSLPRAMKSIGNLYDAMVSVLKPRWVPLWLWKVWLKLRP